MVEFMHACILYMVLILDGNSEHVEHVLGKIGLFGKKIQFVTALDLSRCLKQIK